MHKPGYTFWKFSCLWNHNWNLWKQKKKFIADLDQQLLDFDRIAEKNNLCIAGDLNISFGDNYYFTEEGRTKLNTSFEKNNLLNLTEKIPRNIDHIILTKTFIEQKTIQLHPWNLEPDKKLSDHMGVAVTIVSP